VISARFAEPRRIDVNVIRYHQGGWVSVTVDGTTHEVRPDEWFGFRDHSWGVRQAVGAPPTDLIRHRGAERVIEVEALGDSGFFLKTGGYGAWAGHIHGVWKGQLHFDGEYIADCWDDEHLRSLGQFRDTPIRVREGEAVGSESWRASSAASGPSSASPPSPTTRSLTPESRTPPAAMGAVPAANTLLP